MPFHLWSSITIESPVWRQRRRHYWDVRGKAQQRSPFTHQGWGEFETGPSLPTSLGNSTRLGVHVLDQLLMLSAAEVN